METTWQADSSTPDREAYLPNTIMIGKDTTASTKFEPATFTKNVVQIAEDNQRVLNIILSHDTSQGKKHAGNTLFINDINAHFADVSGHIIK